LRPGELVDLARVLIAPGPGLIAAEKPVKEVQDALKKAQ